MKTVGERVKEERKKRKWSQQDLASRIGATQAAVSEIERDIPRSSGLIIAIAKAFNENLKRLLLKIYKKLIIYISILLTLFKRILIIKHITTISRLSRNSIPT